MDDAVALTQLPTAAEGTVGGYQRSRNPASRVRERILLAEQRRLAVQHTLIIDQPRLVLIQ